MKSFKLLKKTPENQTNPGSIDKVICSQSILIYLSYYNKWRKKTVNMCAEQPLSILISFYQMLINCLYHKKSTQANTSKINSLGIYWRKCFESRIDQCTLGCFKGKKNANGKNLNVLTLSPYIQILMTLKIPVKFIVALIFNIWIQLLVQ